MERLDKAVAVAEEGVMNNTDVKKTVTGGLAKRMYTSFVGFVRMSKYAHKTICWGRR